MNEETTYYEDILFEKLTKDKDRRRNILIDLNVALQKYQRVVASIKDFREIQEYKIAVVSVENELHEIEKENKKLKEKLQQKENEIKELCEKIKFNEKTRRKMQKSLMKKLQKKENIIKEAKEYIINNSLYEEEYDYDYEENIYLSGIHDDDVRRILLEILDNKGDENNGL